MSISKTGIFILSALLIAQAGNSQVKREILAEDPKQVPNLRFDITPLNITASLNDNYDAAEYAFRASYRWNNKFSVSAEYRGEIVDVTDAATYKTENYNGHAYEVFGTYYFSVKEKEKEVMLRVKSKSVGMNTVEVTVDPLPVSRLVMYGTRLGYGGISNTAPLYSSTLVNTNGSGETLDENVQPIQKSGLVFAGLSAMKIQNIKVKYPVYGTRRKQFVREYFLDGIYSVSNSFSNVKKTVNGKTNEYRVVPEAAINRIGARIGLFNTSIGRVVNWGWGMEMGFLPRSSTFSDSFYYNFRFSIPLAFKLNQSKE